MKSKTKGWISAVMLLAVIGANAFMLTAGCQQKDLYPNECGTVKRPHEFDDWTNPDGAMQQFRHCKNCNFIRSRRVVYENP